VPASSRAEATEGVRRAPLFWRLVAALLLAVPLAAVLLGPLAARADANPTIKVQGPLRGLRDQPRDPIALSDHLHHQIGNTSTTNKSTANSLLNNRGTSCNEGWFTSAGWFPVERHKPVRGVNVYYRAPGNQKTIKAIPKGLQLLATEQTYNCGRGAPFASLPRYGCKDSWATSVTFPDCIDTSRLANEGKNAVMSRSGTRPSTHPYRIARINFLVSHQNAGGMVPNPLRVSAGTNTWEPYTFMHADYFAANQPVFNRELLDLCLRDAPDRVTFASPRCGQRP
jgi:hypothetical protein